MMLDLCIEAPRHENMSICPCIFPVKDAAFHLRAAYPQNKDFIVIGEASHKMYLLEINSIGKQCKSFMKSQTIMRPRFLT